MASRPFFDTLREIRRGQILDDCADELAKAVLSVFLHDRNELGLELFAFGQGQVAGGVDKHFGFLGLGATAQVAEQTPAAAMLQMQVENEHSRQLLVEGGAGIAFVGKDGGRGAIVSGGKEAFGIDHGVQQRAGQRIAGSSSDQRIYATRKRTRNVYFFGGTCYERGSSSRTARVGTYGRYGFVF